MYSITYFITAMPKTLVHIQKPREHVIFNPNLIQSIHKTDNGVSIYFLYDKIPLELEGEAAKAYWDEVYESSNKVYPKPEEEPDNPYEVHM